SLIHNRELLVLAFRTLALTSKNCALVVKNPICPELPLDGPVTVMPIILPVTSAVPSLGAALLKPFTPDDERLTFAVPALTTFKVTSPPALTVMSPLLVVTPLAPANVDAALTVPMLKALSPLKLISAPEALSEAARVPVT